jgi:N-acylneuraminate cytidylyltransferase
MYYSENGDELKKFNTRDGMGLKMLQQSGLKIGVITAEDRDLNRRRSKKLNLDFEFHKAEDKFQVLGELCEKYKVTSDQIAYVGDDLNDLKLLQAVGFSACPLDACREVKEVVNFISSFKGGQGVIRELSNLFFQ